jgi:glycyl-tRNA synthetase
MAEKRAVTMEKLVSLCKNRGFIFPGSEIYGGLANTWDYGPLGVELKNNVKKAWWKKFVQENPYNTGVDCAILMNTRTWKASGHLGGFSDPLMDCKSCKARHRADNLVENYVAKKGLDVKVEAMDNDALEAFIAEHKIVCPICGNSDFTSIRKFNLMFKTFQGVTEDSANTVYLRPETAQGIFVNYLNVQKTGRMKLPFGIAQIGKAFRNEIVARQFIFRMREFEQMEMQFFVKPGTELEWFNQWKDTRMAWHQALGFGAENYRYHDHEKLAHYANAACDIEFRMPFGFKEVEGIHSRTNFDLSQHAQYSGRKIEYFDPETNERYTPYVIETSIGVDRMFLSVMCHSYEEETLENGETRVVLRLPAALAPTKLAVMPLVKKDGLPEKAREIMDDLKFHFNCKYDEKDSIGKRYRRQDAVGTPFCITIDHDTLKDDCVTLRNRDTMEQQRVKISDLRGLIEDQVSLTSLLKKI